MNTCHCGKILVMRESPAMFIVRDARKSHLSFHRALRGSECYDKNKKSFCT